MKFLECKENEYIMMDDIIVYVKILKNALAQLVYKVASSKKLGINVINGIGMDSNNIPLTKL